MTGWRVIFMGTPEFACPSLQTLIDRQENIVGVFTQPDRPKGRGHKMQPPPVKELALRHSLPVYQPLKVRAPDAVELVRSLEPDVIVVVAFGQILPQSLLDIPPCGCINVHASLLPRYRGAAPLNWCIINGETETGVTTMLMDAGLDTGPMLLKRSTPIDPDEDAAALHDRLSRLGAEILADTLDGIMSDAIVPEPQDDAGTCYAPLLKKEHGIIDWSRCATDIHNMVRGLSSWPGVLAEFGSEHLKLHRTVIGRGHGEPGRILSVGREGIEVACGSGSLVIKEIQPSGGRRMDAAAFLAGRPLEAGMSFEAKGAA